MENKNNIIYPDKYIKSRLKDNQLITKSLQEDIDTITNFENSNDFIKFDSLKGPFYRVYIDKKV